MVSNERDSGGPDGLLAVVAIAIVLFFAIKIYSDYVTATGQAVKPGSGRKNSGADASRSTRERDRSESTDEPESSTDEPRSDSALITRSATLSARRHRPARTAGESAPVADPEVLPSGADREVPVTLKTGTREHRSPDAAASSFDNPRTVTRASLFRYPSPYPADLDDVQIGDKLSQIRRMDLPQGNLYRSIYSYHPERGPFKTVYCMLTVGPRDPKVTSVLYLFKDTRSEVRVRQQAVEAFGDSVSNPAVTGRRLAWPHLDRYNVVLEPDRYSVEEDLSGARDEAPSRSEADATAE